MRRSVESNATCEPLVAFVETLDLDTPDPNLLE